MRDAEVNKLGADHPLTLTTLNNLAEAYLAAGKLPRAVPLFEEAAAGIEKRNYLHLDAAQIIPSTINAYEAAERFDKAEAWRRKWLAVVKQKTGAESPDYAGELDGLGLNLLRRKKYTDAEPILRECLILREKLLEIKQVAPWQVANVKSMLGEALLEQEKLAEAGPLLVAGYEGLNRANHAIPNLTVYSLHGPTKNVRDKLMTEAIQRLIGLAWAMNKPGDVIKWTAEIAHYAPQEPVKTPDKPVPEKQGRPKTEAATEKKPVKP